MIIQWTRGAVYPDNGTGNGMVTGNYQGWIGSVPPPAPSAASSGHLGMGMSYVSRSMGGEQFTYDYIRSISQGMSLPANPTM